MYPAVAPQRDDHQQILRLLDSRVNMVERLTRLEEEVKGLRNARKAAQSSWKLLAQALVAACAIAALILQVVHH